MLAASLLLIGLHALAQDKPELRTWKDSKGQNPVKAAFLSYEKGKVRLRREDGKEFSVSLSRFSAADRRCVRAEIARRKSKPGS